MPDDPPSAPAALSPASLAFLDAWLRERGGDLLQPDPPLALSTDLLVRYLSGALPPDMAGKVERGLVAAPPSERQRLRTTLAELDALQTRPWADVWVQAQAAGEATPAAQIARAWLAVVAERLGAAATNDTPVALPAWDLKRDARAGVVRAQTTWTAFLRFGARWSAEQHNLLASPLRVALARGSGSSGDEERIALANAPAGVRAVCEHADVDADGALHVAVRFADEANNTSTILDDQTAHLALGTNAETWPVAAQKIASGRAVWRLPGLGADLRLDPGPLAADWLRLSLGDAFAPALLTTAGQTRLSVSVVGAAPGQRDAGVFVNLHGLPRWENGVFHALVALPRTLRDAYPAHLLEIEIAVTPERRLRLGAWPVAGWTSDDTRPLQAPCPGAPDAVLSLTTLLEAFLAPPDAAEP